MGVGAVADIRTLILIFLTTRVHFKGAHLAAFPLYSTHLCAECNDRQNKDCMVKTHSDVWTDQDQQCLTLDAHSPVPAGPSGVPPRVRWMDI